MFEVAVLYLYDSLRNNTTKDYIHIYIFAEKYQALREKRLRNPS